VSLEAENQQLGGKKDTVGTGGDVSTLATQLGAAAATTNPTALASGTGYSAPGLYALSETVRG
jgi:hypothetical protein